MIRRASKTLSDVEGEELWTEVRPAVVGVILPVFRNLFDAGAALAQRVKPRDLVMKADDESGPITLANYWTLFSEFPEFMVALEKIDAAGDEFIKNYIDDWWRQFSAAGQKRIRKIILQARTEGLETQAVIDLAKGYFNKGLAQRIAVSEVTNVLGGAAQATYNAAGFPGWEWQTVKDAWVDQECVDLQGRRFPMTVLFQKAHYGCVAEGSVVSGGPVLASTRRFYAGDMVVLVSSGGNELTVTPNHPVATPEGWVAAGLLREGDDVVTQISERMTLVGPDHEQMPSRVEEVAAALLRSRGMFAGSVPGSPEQFHGDGTIDGEVDVVGPARLLRSDTAILSPKAFNKPLLAFAASNRERGLLGGGAPRQLVGTGYSPLRGNVGRRNLASPLLSIHPRPLQLLGRGLATNLDSSLEEAPADGPTVHSEGFGKDVLTLASGIPRDDGCVVERLTVVRRVTGWKGHVYNLETDNGWYASNGIVVHNCRCWPVPFGDVTPLFGDRPLPVGNADGMFSG